MRTSRRLLGVGLCVGSLVLVVSACGSSSGSSSGSKGSPTSSAQAGNPIVFSVMDEMTGPVAAPELAAGAQAAAAAINAAGGVTPKGGGAARPIKLLTCDSNNFTNPSAVEDCARSAVQGGAILSVSDYSLGGDDVKVFSQAGIAMLGTLAFDNADLTTPGVYPFLNGTVLNGGGFVALKHAGAKSIQYIGIQNTDAAQLAAADAQFVKGSVTTMTPVLVPSDPSADITPYFATVNNNNPGGLFIGAPSGLAQKIIPGVRAAGYKGNMALTELNVPVQSAWTKDYNGLIVAADFDAVTDTANPTIAAFQKDMQTYQPKALINEWALNAWLAVKLAAQTATELDKIDAASFAAAFKDRKVNLGVAPPFTFGQAAPFPIKFPNLFRTNIQVHQIKDGKDVVVGNGDFVNIISGNTVPLEPCSKTCPELLG